MNMSNRYPKILVYLRKPNADYTEELASSIHFAYCEGEHDFHPLNQNYGILFAEAIVNEQNVICPQNLKNPYLFQNEDGNFGIIACRVSKDGKEEAGKVSYWTSRDLLHFNYEGMVFFDSLPLAGKMKNPCSSCDNIIKDDLCDIIPGNCLSISEDMLREIKDYWMPVYHSETLIDKKEVHSFEELLQVSATAKYSDGSTARKKVMWNAKKEDFTKPGKYEINGIVVQENFAFPIADGFADPVILPKDNKYYFISTNDNTGDIGIYVREADTKEALFKSGYKESIILDKDEEKGFIQTFWAPEFHYINEDLYVLFAVGPKNWGPQCHMMRLKKGGDIMNPNDWETPVRVMKRDGSPLAANGITLDMTYFKAGGVSCLAWSYREHIMEPLDTGSMIFIATIDETNPTCLNSDPVLLTRPLYGWENIQGTINNEGPYALVTEKQVYLTYSGGAANGYTYALGMLSIPVGGDYLNPSAWTKSPTPVLSYYSLDDVYGPGHNSFFRDYDGNIFILYHGETKLAHGDIRKGGMHRVHFNKNGRPVFNVYKERDLNPSLNNVTIELILEP